MMPGFLSATYLYPILWLAIALALGALEAATVQLVAIWFALGAVVAMFAALFGATFSSQLVVFALVSAAALAVTRPLLRRYIHVQKVPTNADSIVGTTGTMTEEIRSDRPLGRAHVAGLSWSARSADGSPIEKGEQVIVRAIEGVKVVVEKLPQN